MNRLLTILVATLATFVAAAGTALAGDTPATVESSLGFIAGDPPQFVVAASYGGAEIKSIEVEEVLEGNQIGSWTVISVKKGTSPDGKAVYWGTSIFASEGPSPVGKLYRIKSVTLADGTVIPYTDSRLPGDSGPYEGKDKVSKLAPKEATAKPSSSSSKSSESTPGEEGEGNKDLVQWLIVGLIAIGGMGGVAWRRGKRKGSASTTQLTNRHDKTMAKESDAEGEASLKEVDEKIDGFEHASGYTSRRAGHDVADPQKKK